MAELVQIASGSSAATAGKTCATKPRPGGRVFWLQGVTLAWMAVELGVSAYAAVTAHSPAMLAFGSDSLVELISATVVLLQWSPRVTIAEGTASRAAAVLLYALAAVVTGTATAALLLRARPGTSCAGMSITAAALIAMPVLAWLKRGEARRNGNAALAADAAQSATCAYLALVALIGLGVNALFHIGWVDAAAALLAVPLLVREGRSAWHGQVCACC